MELSQAPTSHNFCIDVDEEPDQDPQHRLSPSAAAAVADEQASSSSSCRAAAAVEKEHMFDKVVTPSDVGKLNRLVIPKQYAEKFFPLDTAANEKGLLLNFEDRAGKPWRFRYSYWNSSQSYVMTKGWSRFVKDKRLDAGDTVSFSRGRGQQHAHRLFIDWKRRPDILHHPHHRLPLPTSSNYPMLSFGAPWSAGRLLVPPAAMYDVAHRQSFAYNAAGAAGQYLVFRSPMVQPAPMVLDSVPVGHGPGPTTAAAAAATSKRVRLFGVNLDSPPDCAPVASSASPSPRGKEKEEPSLDLDMNT